MGIAVSSIVFALYHIVNLTAMSIELVILQVIYSIAIGVSFIIIFYITKSLLPCIKIHVLTDITTFLFAEDMRFEFEVIGIAITILIAAFYAILYTRTLRKVKMKKENKIKLLMTLLILGVVMFALELFVIKLDGTVGLIFTIISVLLIVESILALYRTSEKFKSWFLAFLKVLFFWD